MSRERARACWEIIFPCRHLGFNFFFDFDNSSKGGRQKRFIDQKITSAEAKKVITVCRPPPKSLPDPKNTKHFCSTRLFPCRIIDFYLSFRSSLESARCILARASARGSKFIHLTTRREWTNMRVNTFCVFVSVDCVEVDEMGGTA